MNWKILISAFALVPATFIVVVAPVIRNQRQLIYPSAKTVSVFLKNYSPEPVTERFRSDWSSDLAEATDATAGRLFITNRYEFNSGFAIEAVKQTPLMHALYDDLYTRLVRSGASVVDHHGDPDAGYDFDYRLGNSVGTVTLLPMKPNPRIHRNTPLPEGISDMTVEVVAVEKWFPNKAEARQASLPLR